MTSKSFFPLFTIRFTLAALLLMACTATVQAQPKIATVDLKKVFDGFYRTKQADAQLKEKVTDAEKVLKGMMDDYQAANEGYKTLVEGANDQAISSEERQRRKQSAEAKLREIQEIEQSVTQYRRTMQTSLKDQELRARQNILQLIQEVITRKASAGNYALVLDTAAESVNQTPIVLFTNGANDLTNEVLAEINQSAPAGLLKK